MTLNNIYVFGCSYATGEEILLDTLSEEAKSLRHSVQDPRAWFHYVEQTCLAQYKQILEQQKQLSWPNKLADLLNVDCINFAESGNSMQKITWQVLNFVNSTKLTEQDLILISLTKPDRNVFFDTAPVSFQISTMLGEGLVGVSETGNARTILGQDKDKVLLDWFTDDRIFWDFLNSLMVLENLSRQYNIKIVPAMRMGSYDLKSYNKDLFNTIYSKLKRSFLCDLSMDEFTDNYYLWGHPSAQAHTAYAEYIYGELMNG